MMKNNIKLSEIELNVRENGNFRFVSFFFLFHVENWKEIDLHVYLLHREKKFVENNPDNIEDRKG